MLLGTLNNYLTTEILEGSGQIYYYKISRAADCRRKMPVAGEKASDA